MFVVAPGSGTGPGGFDEQALNKLKEMAQVNVVLPTNSETGEVLKSETEDNLIQMGNELYKYMVSNTEKFDLNLVFAGSRGGFVVATLIREAMKNSGTLGNVNFLVKNGFEATPRSWFEAMETKPLFPLVVLTGDEDYMNRVGFENQKFFERNWTGPVKVIHGASWTHQMKTPDYAIEFALLNNFQSEYIER